MKKKTTIFIRDGEVRSYEDPLRRLAPVEKISSADNHYEIPSSSRGKVPRQRTVYSQRLIFRLKMFFLFILSFVLGASVSLREVVSLSQFSIILIIRSACAIASSYFFSRLFFLEIGKSATERRRLKASRVVLYVIFCGQYVLLFISICAAVIFYDGDESLIKGDYSQIKLRGALSEDSADAVELILWVSFAVWVLAVIIAIINRIIVAAHNSCQSYAENVTQTSLPNENERKLQAMIYYNKRVYFRLKTFLISFLLGILHLFLIIIYPKYPLLLPTLTIAILKNYYFFRMFFLGIGESPKKQKRLKASRSILYTVSCGGAVFWHVCWDTLLSIAKEESIRIHSPFDTDGIIDSLSEDSLIGAGLVMIVLFILWIIAIIIAIFNKIQVNVHNQE